MISALAAQHEVPQMTKSGCANGENQLVRGNFKEEKDLALAKASKATGLSGVVKKMDKDYTSILISSGTSPSSEE